MKERRKSERLDVPMPIKCRVIHNGECIKEFDTTTKNISDNGLCLYFKDFVPLSSRFIVELFLSEHINEVIQPKWIHKRPGNDLFEIGGHFVEDYNKDKEILTAVVDKVKKMQRKHQAQPA